MYNSMVFNRYLGSEDDRERGGMLGIREKTLPFFKKISKDDA